MYMIVYRFDVLRLLLYVKNIQVNVGLKINKNNRTKIHDPELENSDFSCVPNAPSRINSRKGVVGT